ncbi:prephenate dehydrogenase [Leuconostoc citreum]|uniref:prephenate dehydrogenase n=1 Tax=Leuconostoc citreum TaxID=33964 RepID=UPI000543E92E|nr:prephenate dehydrogenase/arogenate dehydrogenase family protein [Leuconostoc citreum]CDX66316.1 Prephenate dehydrogenase [Leuconostoc citreum]
MIIVIQGLGEMGASLASALSQRVENHVIGIDNQLLSRQYAMANNIVDETATSLSDVVSRAEVIILATPIAVIKQTLKQLAVLPLKPNVIITDTGSTKSEIMSLAEAFVPKTATFIGGHAMAGTQNSGVSAANSDLYREVPYFLVTKHAPKETVIKLQSILAPIAARFIEIDAQQHDELVSWISDVPHIVSFALMNAVMQHFHSVSDFGPYVAGGFKDTTRIAASNPEVWRDILLSNKAAILSSNQDLIDELHRFNQVLRQNDSLGLEKLITQAQHARQQL